MKGHSARSARPPTETPEWVTVANRRDHRRTRRRPNLFGPARFRRQRAARVVPCDEHGRAWWFVPDRV